MGNNKYIAATTETKETQRNTQGEIIIIGSGQIETVSGDSGGPWILCNLSNPITQLHTQSKLLQQCKLIGITAGGNVITPDRRTYRSTATDLGGINQITKQLF